MKLLVDLQACQNSSRHRGIGRYSRSLVRAIARNSPAGTVYVLLNGLFPDTIDSIKQDLAPWVPSEAFVVLAAVGPVAELDPKNRSRRRAAELMREALIADIAPDAVLVSSMVEGATDDSVASFGWVDSAALQTAILYDLIPLLEPDQHLQSPAARAWYRDKVDSFRRADLLFAISDASRQVALAHLGLPSSAVITISGAADELFERAVVREEEIAQVRRRHGIDRPYLMHSGNIEPRKNFDGLVRAFAGLPYELRNGYQLVLVGRVDEAGCRELRELAAARGLGPSDLILTGHVDDSDLLALYSGCHLFVFPSLHEGFGLPPLEAMHCGAPVIGSNTTSVAEVIDLPDAMFDPTSDDAIAASIRRCLEDADHCARLRARSRERAKSFNWDACARRLLEAIEGRIAAGHANAPRTQALLHGSTRLHDGIVAAFPAVCAADSVLAEIATSLAHNASEVTRLRASASFRGAIRGTLVPSMEADAESRAFLSALAEALRALGHHITFRDDHLRRDADESAPFVTASLNQRRDSEEPSPVRFVEPVRSASIDFVLHFDATIPPASGGRNPVSSDRVREHAPASRESAQLAGTLFRTLDPRRARLAASHDGFVAAVGFGIGQAEDSRRPDAGGAPSSLTVFVHWVSDPHDDGTDLLLDAYTHGFTSDDPVTLHVVSASTCSSAVESLVASYIGRCECPPQLRVTVDDRPASDRRELLSRCDLLVAPSRSDTASAAIAEACMAGVPAIAPRFGSHLDFCSDSCAWLIDFGYVDRHLDADQGEALGVRVKPAALTAAMRRAFETPFGERSAMAAEARSRLLNDGSWPRVAARFVHLLDRHVQDRLPPGAIDAMGPAQGRPTGRCGGLERGESRIDERGPEPGESTVAVVAFDDDVFADPSFEQWLEGRNQAEGPVVAVMPKGYPGATDRSSRSMSARAARGLDRCAVVCVDDAAQANELKALGVSTLLVPLTGSHDARSRRLAAIGGRLQGARRDQELSMGPRSRQIAVRDAELKGGSLVVKESAGPIELEVRAPLRRGRWLLQVLGARADSAKDLRVRRICADGVAQPIVSVRGGRPGGVLSDVVVDLKAGSRSWRIELHETGGARGEVSGPVVIGGVRILPVKGDRHLHTTCDVAESVHAASA